MPPLGSTKKSNRDCLVCGGQTSTAHMGIDVCRACTVFYRRSTGKKPYVCRTSTNLCRAGNGLNCKRCRLHHLEQILAQSGAKRSPAPPSPLVDDPAPSPIQEQPSTSTASPPAPPAAAPPHQESSAERPRPLLARVRIAYEKLNYARMIGEVFSRKEPPAPIKIDAKNPPVFPATFGSMNHANRILMTCIMEFGASAFPEFEQLSDEDKWQIAVKFFYTFRLIDNSYRASKRFPDHPTRGFGSYTLWLSEDVVEHFFDDLDSTIGDVEEAKKIMAHNCGRGPKVGKAIMARMNPDEEEFLALLALAFWATNGLGASDAITCASELNRHRAFAELHTYYRDVRRLDEYAARLGELYMLLPIFERHERVKETFEVFRLLDIYADDSFTYTLSKS